MHHTLQTVQGLAAGSGRLKATSVRHADTEQVRAAAGMRELLIETPAGYVIKGIPPGRLALISWQPASMP